MPNTPENATGGSQFTAEQLRTALATFVPQNATYAERVAAIERGLRTVGGRSIRETMAKWIVDGIVPVSRLVPDSYEKWRPLPPASSLFPGFWGPIST